MIEPRVFTDYWQAKRWGHSQDVIDGASFRGINKLPNGRWLVRVHYPSHETFLAAELTRSGAKQAGVYCRSCPPSRNEELFKHLDVHRLRKVAKKDLNRETFRLIEILSDSSAPDDDYPTCAVNGCGEPGKHSHHWAPSAVWGAAANDWPRSDLCITHHQEWHGTIVKLGFRYPAQNDRAIECGHCCGSGYWAPPWLETSWVDRDRCSTCEGRGWVFEDAAAAAFIDPYIQEVAL